MRANLAHCLGIGSIRPTRLIPGIAIFLLLSSCHSVVLAPSVLKRPPAYPRAADAYPTPTAPSADTSSLTLESALAHARAADPTARRHAAEIAEAKTSLLRSQERNDPELRVGLGTDSLSTGLRFRPMPRAVLEARVGTASATVAAAEAAAAAETWDLEMPIREKFVEIHFLTQALVSCQNDYGE